MQSESNEQALYSGDSMHKTWSRFCAYFGIAATRVAGLMGSPFAFLLAILAVVIWVLMGPRHHYSDTWQLVINTGTTIITFLMVFLIQNTQNRDGRAIHLKLDELIRSVHAAHNEMIDIEKLSDEELGKLAKRYERIRLEYDLRHGSR
jgi:low affinity Fe/Cu permease